MSKAKEQKRADPMGTLRGLFHDNDLEKVKRMVQDEKISVTEPQYICEASHHDCPDIIKWLHEQGSDITANDNLPLKNAVWHNQTEIVKYLVTNGAEVGSQDNNVIVQASEHGNLELVKYLVSKGADITAQENASAYCAAEKRHFNVVQYLYEQGADLNGICNKSEVMKYMLDNCEVKYSILPYK